jgi:hypothetical protein
MPLRASITRSLAASPSIGVFRVPGGISISHFLFFRDRLDRFGLWILLQTRAIWGENGADVLDVSLKNSVGDYQAQCRMLLIPRIIKMHGRQQETAKGGFHVPIR